MITFTPNFMGKMKNAPNFVLGQGFCQKNFSQGRAFEQDFSGSGVSLVGGGGGGGGVGGWSLVKLIAALTISIFLPTGSLSSIVV